MTDDWVQIDPNFMSMSTAIEEVVRISPIGTALKLTGGSGRGWSRWSNLQRCPRKYYFDYELLPTSSLTPMSTATPSKALEVGSLVHALLAVYYWTIQQRALLDDPLPQWFFNELCKRNINPENAATGWRVYQAYRDFYGDRDYLQPLAIEETVTDPATGHTCRYDLIVRVTGATTLADGTYICEHKSAGVFDENTLDGWDIDGEILGELAWYVRAGLESKYGPLQGVIVNLLGKQKRPQFHRVLVSPSSFQLDAHVLDLEYWAGLEQRYRDAGYWPRALANCINRWGRCQYYEHCRRGTAP